MQQTTKVKLDYFTVQFFSTSKSPHLNKADRDLPVKIGNLITALPENYEDSILSIFQSFVHYLGTEWRVTNNQKCIKIPQAEQDNMLKYSDEDRYFYGYFDGGTTGRTHRVYENGLKEQAPEGWEAEYKEESIEETFLEFDKNAISTLRYYFLICLPSNSNTGLVVVQGTPSDSCTSEFKYHLTKFFNEFYEETSAKVTRYITDDIATKILAERTLQSLSLVKAVKYPTDASKFVQGPDFFEDMKVEVRFSGKKYLTWFKQFALSKSHKIPLSHQLVELGLEENDVEIKYKLEDENKRVTTMSSKKEMDFLPTLYYDIPCDDNNNPIFGDLHERVIYEVNLILNKFGLK